MYNGAVFCIDGDSQLQTGQSMSSSGSHIGCLIVSNLPSPSTHPRMKNVSARSGLCPTLHLDDDSPSRRARSFQVAVCSRPRVAV